VPKIDIAAVPERTGSGYPAPHHLPCMARVRKALGDVAGLNDFGVNLLTLPAGSWSSQRHWHSSEDEFVFVISGEVVLVTDAGDTVLRTGDCAGFPKNEPDGHKLVNRSDKPALCLEVGTRSPDDFCTYSDIDMVIDAKIDRFAHKDGSFYPEREPK
jgi:uncharacterized cupin superfamily protein